MLHQIAMYGSTRGSVSGLTFQQTLFSGYLGDGGLVVPQRLPAVDLETLKTWSSLSYVELAKKILPLFIPDNEIKESVLGGKRCIMHNYFSWIDYSNKSVKHAAVSNPRSYALCWVRRRSSFCIGLSKCRIKLTEGLWWISASAKIMCVSELHSVHYTALMVDQ